MAAKSSVKKILHGLDSREYEHPLDRKALQALEQTPGLDALIKKVNQIGLERYLRLQYTGSYTKVTKYNHPGLHHALVVGCKVLGVRVVPDLYITRDFSINASTYGVDRQLIAISSGCVDYLSLNEQLYILGHELGHIKSKHVMYHQMAQALPLIGQIVGTATFGLGGLLSTALQAALLAWQRKSEFTADRAGLLVCQDMNAATTAMMKAAGAPMCSYEKLNPRHFIAQAREFDGYDDSADTMWKAISIMFADHPWMVMRAAELQKWIETGAYSRVMTRMKAISY